MLADWNGVVPTQFDRTSSNEIKLQTNYQYLFFKLDNLVLRMHGGVKIDLQENIYIYFSERHKSFSRICMIWLSTNLANKIAKVEILPKCF